MVVLKTDFSHCPLKKRPLSVCYEASAGEQTEPHDLSLKCTREVAPDHTEALHIETQERNPRDIPHEEHRAQVTHTQHLPSRYTPTTSSPAGPTNTRLTSCHGNTSYSPHDDVCMEDQTSDSRDIPGTSLRLPINPASRGQEGFSTESRSNMYERGIRHHPTDLGSPMPGTTCSQVAVPDPTQSTSSPSYLRLHQDISGSRSSLSMSRNPMETPRTLSKPARSDLEQQQSSSSSFSAPPHRPWLVEGPLRSIHRQYPDINVPLPPARPRPLLAGSPGLWAGVVPLSWAVPPLLPPPRPPSPGRPRLDCRSPGSESASSDGSSGGGRGETRYSCTECTKSYSTYSGLSKHKQFHCAALGAKSFGCKHCDKVYTSLGALKMHIRTHTLPCKCHLCGKAFSRPWLLQGHIRTHTGEKPFQCSQCDRCFADRSNLRAHLQTHAHVKKYACTTCHKTFSRMSLLNKHTEAACPAIHRRVVP